MKTIPELQALLDADKELMNDFIRYAARNGVQPDYKDIARSRKLIEAQLRAYIGRNTPLNEAGFYVNIYPIDPVMLRAVEVLKPKTTMTKRIIGLILAIAAIAVIVIAAIRHNTYTSMIGPAATEMPAPEKTGQKNRRRKLCGPIRSLRPNPTRYGKRAAMQGRNSNRKQSYDRNIPVRRQRERTGSDMAIRLLHIPREKASVKFPDRNPRHSESVRGFRLEGFRCFSKTLLLRHRPASYGRIVVGVSKRISPLSLKHSALLIFLSHLIIILVTRIVRRSRILRRDGENTAIRPVIERNFHPLYCIRTW